MVSSLKTRMKQVQIQKAKQKIQVPYIYSNAAVTEGTSAAPRASSAGVTSSVGATSPAVATSSAGAISSSGAKSAAVAAASAVEDLLCKIKLPTPALSLSQAWHSMH